MATQISTLTPIDPFPTRVLPQERFDEAVKTNMSQLSGMIGELNASFIPSVNTISTQIETNANTANTAATTATNKAVEASESATTATTKAGEASESATTASTKAGEAAASAALAVQVVGSGIATTSNVGLVKPDGTTVQVDGTTGLLSIADGTTSAKGLVRLEDSTSSTSTTKAATPNSVKQAYDLANGKYTAAMATDSTAGLVKPDNSSINVNAGVISVDNDYIADIVIDTLLISERGCLLTRSANGISTTIKYKNWKGNVALMEVIDAQYRPDDQQFGTYGTDSSLTNFSSDNGTDWFFGQGTLTSYTRTDLPDYITNSFVYSLWGPSLAADLTAKENCDVWMTYDGIIDSQSISGVPAVKTCRDLTVNSANGTWDLPNEFELIILFMLADIIDSMDPTAESYPAKKIGKTHSSGRFRNTGFWSSTEYSDTNTRFVNAFGYNASLGKDFFRSLLPVREFTMNS